MKKEIKWSPKLWDINKIKPTPNNFKIKTDLGRERLEHSMKKFGNAGSVTVNLDGTLINGNSRWEREKAKGVKKLWAMTPDRQLSPKDFQEFAAMFDFATAGKVDTDRILKELGTHESFFKQWGVEMPFDLLEKMGSKADMNGLEYPDTNVKGNGKEEQVKDIRMVQIFFTVTQEEKFRKMEIELRKRFMVKTTTDLVFKLAEQQCKLYKIKIK